MDGVKFGDSQATLTGMSLAMYFLFLSWSKPLEKLSSERPHTSVFSPYMLLSIIFQFSLHLYVLITAVDMSRPHTEMDDEMRDPDGKFKPNLLNSVVFLVSQLTTVSTFAVNYRGRPFMEGLRENIALYRGLVFAGFIVFACALNLSDDLTEFFQMVPFPSEDFRMDLLKLLVLDLAGAFAIERSLRFIFKRNPPKI
jgi:cation-transporting ATPase 13A1